MGNHHARTYAQAPGCTLVAVVDKDAERARKVAAEHGGRALACAADVLDEVDAVSVAVPTAFHEEVALPFIERGAAVLVEKPLAPDAAAAQRMLAAVRHCGGIMQVGHSERFNPVVQAMLRMGVRPKFIETHRVSPFTFRSADIGVVFDMMIHDIDIVLHLISGNTQARRPEYEVQAVGVSVLGPHEDVANARVQFADGSVVNMTASRLALKTERKIRIFCPTAYISMDYHKKSGIAIKLDDNLDLIRIARERHFEDLSQMQHLDFGSMMKVEPLIVQDVDPLRAEIESFLNCVRTGQTPPVSAEDGAAAVEMAERIASAVRAQRWAVGESPKESS